MEQNIFPLTVWEEKKWSTKTLRMLDLFAGRLGWTKAFLARGWECVAVDLVCPPDIKNGVEFINADIMKLIFNPHTKDTKWWQVLDDYLGVSFERVDFICASSPCEQFSVHGMKHFHPNPPYPSKGIELFNHTRAICEASQVPYCMENVRAAQQFVGTAMNHCGSFYLWGSGVPPVLPKGFTKGFRHTEMFAHDRTNRSHASATIPPELAFCVADYATNLVKMREEINA